MIRAGKDSQGTARRLSESVSHPSQPSMSVIRVPRRDGARTESKLRFALPFRGQHAGPNFADIEIQAKMS